MAQIRELGIAAIVMYFSMGIMLMACLQRLDRIIALLERDKPAQK